MRTENQTQNSAKDRANKIKNNMILIRIMVVSCEKKYNDIGRHHTNKKIDQNSCRHGMASQ